MNLLVSTFLITFSWTFVRCYNQRDKLFFLQKSSEQDNETLLVVTWMEDNHEISDGCEIFTDEELIKGVLLSSNDSHIRTLPEDKMKNLLGDCTEFTLRRRRRDSEVWAATKLSVEDIDDDPKGLRGNENGRRSPQNTRNQNGDGQRTPQNTRRQSGSGQRDPQNVRKQNGDGQRTPQSDRRQNGDSQRSPQSDRRKNGDCQRSPQGGRRQNGCGQGASQSSKRQNGGGRMPQANSQANRISTTWSTNFIETVAVTTMKSNVRNKTTTETPMNKTKAGASTKAEAGYNTTTEAPTTVHGYTGLPIILPGTKWCGAGDTAKSYTDLGSSEYTDKCCRSHDNCNDTMAPKETRYNLTNTSPFTKLSCQCDEEFYDCLINVNSITANTVGNMYFNVLRRECYKKEYPQTKECKKYRTLFKLACLEYEKDTSAPQVYQWIPAKRYWKFTAPGPVNKSRK